MANDPIEANLELGLDWLNALRHGDVDSIAERFEPTVDWVAVSGATACEGREQVLEWLRGSGGRRHAVSGLELQAGESHLVVGIQDATLKELAGVKLDGHLYVVFSVRDGRIARIRDHAQRASAFSEAGLGHQRRQ